MKAEYIDKHEAYTLLKDLEAAYIYPPVREAYRTAARHIDQIKPADVQPVRHGRWIKVPGKYGDHFLCSNCGTAEITESGEDGAVWWHDEYCRKCGARMDGDTDA